MENKENIFTKLINFFKNIFVKEKIKQIPEKTESIETNERRNKFLENLKVENKSNEEDPRLLNLQREYENGELDLCLMSDEQVKELNALYKRQVLELRRNLNDKKTELSMLQNKIKAN